MDGLSDERAFWDRHARFDPLWAILSDPSKSGRRWDLRGFLETGRREISLLMYQLRALGLKVHRDAALDFGCGIGRLTQPLAAYFERVVGIDVSPEMIRLANDINQHRSRVHYVCNVRADLDLLATGEFAFMYTNVVLQHIEPTHALRYLEELFRVVGSGGVLVFQLPSHQRPAEDAGPQSTPMPDQAYRAAVRVESDVPQDVVPGAVVGMAASVRNISQHAWAQSQSRTIRLGNHWLSAAGRTMLIQDDGRAALPERIGPGETCRALLSITIPPEPGEYELECDVVHEGVSWFADKGSETWRRTVRVAGSSHNPASEPRSEPALVEHALSLPDLSLVEPPGPLPMHGIHRDQVTELVERHRARLVHVEIDERCGKEWVGYRYFVRKHG